MRLPEKNPDQTRTTLPDCNPNQKNKL